MEVETQTPVVDLQHGLNSMRNDGSSDRSWNVFGSSLPKSEIVFFTQVVLIYIVVITSIVNLTVFKESDGKLWTALLSSSFGYLLPNPTLKKRPTSL